MLAVLIGSVWSFCFFPKIAVNNFSVGSDSSCAEWKLSWVSVVSGVSTRGVSIRGSGVGLYQRSSLLN